MSYGISKNVLFIAFFIFRWVICQPVKLSKAPEIFTQTHDIFQKKLSKNRYVLLKSRRML